MIKKAKLNACAHCPCRENLHVVFDANGRMYFMCAVHKRLLDKLCEAATQIGVCL